jgi:hypothetical protein
MLRRGGHADENGQYQEGECGTFASEVKFFVSILI